MSLPARFPSEVSILFTDRDEPLLVRARALSATDDVVQIELPEGAPPSAPETALILDFPVDGGGGRAIAAVESRDGSRLAVRVVKVPKPDLREFPRMMGGIELRYALAPKGETPEVLTWLAGGAMPAVARSPDPYMSFSTGGFAFDDIETCAEGDLLMLDFLVPDHPQRFRATGRVVRVSRIPIDERDEGVDATHRIAVTLENVSPEARAALVDHTARCQEAYL